MISHRVLKLTSVTNFKTYPKKSSQKSVPKNVIQIHGNGQM